MCGFLLLAVGLIYGQTLGHGFLNYDDSGYVFANSHVRAGLTVDGLRWAFTDGPYGEWYPLDTLSHMLDCQLFGLDAWGHHLTNVLLHAATSIALFLVLWRMTGELWPSAFVAAIFAIHPQNVESVAWVSERRDMLSGLLFMLTLGAYVGYARHGRSPMRYLLVTVVFALALLAKPMVVTLPPVLLLLDFWPLTRIGSAIDIPRSAPLVERSGAVRLVLEKLPLAALAAGDCLMTLRTHGEGGPSLPWPARLGNAAVSCITYIVHLFYPVDLAVFYPYPVNGPPTWEVIGAVAVLALASAAAVAWRRRFPFCFVGWFWYLGMLSPVLGLISISDHAMADRYIYLPGIGLYIALAWGAARMAAGLPAGHRLLAAGAAVVIVPLIACATWQTAFWHDDEALWSHALACTSDNGEAEIGLADELARQGRIEEAIPHYYRAQKRATEAAPYANLGLIFARQGKLDEAIAQFKRGLELEPGSVVAQFNLGLVLMQQKRFDEAREHLCRAIEIDPSSVTAHCGLAHLLRLEGKPAEARAEFERGIALNPKNVLAHNDLAVMLFEQGKFDDSIPHFEAVLAINPSDLRARINLARALTAIGRIEQAIGHYRRVLELDPTHGEAREELGKLLSTGPSPPGPPPR